MNRILSALVAGLIFGLGIAISGMGNPAKVLNFFDPFGTWDPSLAFVMGGAVLVMAIAWTAQRRMLRPAFADAFSLPDRNDLTPRLIGGSALFGIGWGIAGLCPGPGFAAIAIAPASAAIFVAAMLAGMLLVRLVEGNA
jgi:uncharacterized membrane protein YedE/YeeE